MVDVVGQTEQLPERGKEGDLIICLFTRGLVLMSLACQNINEKKSNG